MLSDKACPFCDPLRYEITQGTIAAFKDGFPVSPGHYLLTPLRHTADWFSLSYRETMDTVDLLDVLRKKLLDADDTITGFNIGMNCGESAGQTVFHQHTHLIPRRDGDTPNPRGGVRGVIPSQMTY